MYSPLTPIVVRDVWKDRVWDAVPVIVIAHDAEWLVDHQVPGTRLVGRSCRGREKIDALASGAWELTSTIATDPGLNFYALDGWSRVGLAWSATDGAFQGWYVNFQLPLQPSRFGF